MKHVSVAALFAIVMTLPTAVSADPVPGMYTSALRPGAHPGVQLGHMSVSRQFPNSGNPKIFHGQSWNGSVLGAQWEFRCGVETASVPPVFGPGYDFGTNTGYVTYNQTFDGGTFSLYADPAVGWGSGNGTLNTTSVATQVYLMNGIPLSASFTGVTTGHFDIGCTHDLRDGEWLRGRGDERPALSHQAGHLSHLPRRGLLAGGRAPPVRGVGRRQ